MFLICLVSSLVLQLLDLSGSVELDEVLDLCCDLTGVAPAGPVR